MVLGTTPHYARKLNIVETCFRQPTIQIVADINHEALNEFILMVVDILPFSDDMLVQAHIQNRVPRISRARYSTKSSEHRSLFSFLVFCTFREEPPKVLSLVFCKYFQDASPRPFAYPYSLPFHNSNLPKNPHPQKHLHRQHHPKQPIQPTLSLGKRSQRRRPNGRFPCFSPRK